MTTETTLLINAYCTQTQVQAPDFALQINAWRDQRDSQLQDHLQGFISYVMSRGDPAMSYAKYHIYRHLQRTRQHLSFNISQHDWASLSAWASAANALLFLADGAVRDPQGKVLLSADTGSSEAGAQLPYPASAWQRKQRHDTLLTDMQIHVAAHLPPVVAESEVELRTPYQVAERALALFLVALKGEALCSGNPASVAEIKQQFTLSQEFLSPVELDYFDQAQTDDHTNVQFCWRYESLAVLLWAIGKLPELPAPTQICDVAQIAQVMLAQSELELLQKVSLRPDAEILDALDLHFRLHWAVRQARQDQQLHLGEIQSGVVYERHYALNWLTGFEQAEWDQVDTPT